MKNTKFNNIFDEIHELLREERYVDVLKLMLETSSGKIRMPYTQDLNHAWYIVGDVFYKQENLQQAISCFKKALADYSMDIDALCALGNCYSELGKPKEAAKYLLRGLSLSPDEPTLLYNYANTLFDEERYDEAITSYKLIDKQSDKELYKMAKKNIKKARRAISRKPYL